MDQERKGNEPEAGKHAGLRVGATSGARLREFSRFPDNPTASSSQMGTSTKRGGGRAASPSLSLLCSFVSIAPRHRPLSQEDGLQGPPQMLFLSSSASSSPPSSEPRQRPIPSPATAPQLHLQARAGTPPSHLCDICPSPQSPLCCPLNFTRQPGNPGSLLFHDAKGAPRETNLYWKAK